MGRKEKGGGRGEEGEGRRERGGGRREEGEGRKEKGGRRREEGEGRRREKNEREGRRGTLYAPFTTRTTVPRCVMSQLTWFMSPKRTLSRLLAT